MRNPQLSTTVPTDLYEQVVALAEKESRTLSDMVSLLLQLAVKEKTRPRKRASKDNHTV
jgi:CopG-like RHH_1 or ribbon-helix-helix domain, RHH_5